MLTQLQNFWSCQELLKFSINGGEQIGQTYLMDCNSIVAINIGLQFYANDIADIEIYCSWNEVQDLWVITSYSKGFDILNWWRRGDWYNRLLHERLQHLSLLSWVFIHWMKLKISNMVVISVSKESIILISSPPSIENVESFAIICDNPFILYFSSTAMNFCLYNVICRELQSNINN